MTQEEFAKQFVELDLYAQSYPTGGIPMLVKENKVYIDAEDSHTIIFGATGSKKTRMFVMPSIGILARAGESFVVTDTKGELFERTLGDVETHGYQSCCLNLRNFKDGKTWNPLALPYRYYHNGKKAKAMEFATEMAKMIIGEDMSGDAFWPTTAIDVLCGFILFLFEKAEENECHFKALHELWNSYTSNRDKMIKTIKEEFGGTIIYQKVSSLDNPSEKTVGSIEAFVVMGLNKLSLNEEFVDFLSQDGIDIQQLAEEKYAIYLVIPDENTTYHFMVSLFLEQLYEVLLEKAQKEPTQKLPIRMNFLIDEFANIPKIQNMDAMITAARSRNIRFHLIVQGMKQLQQKYEEGAETISGNCNNWIYLYSKEYELLQEISKLCGEVIYDNNVRMPLFSEFDLQHLNKEEGEALVLAGRNYPCLSNLADIDDYPYPKIEAKQMMTKQSWKKIPPFSLEKKKEQRYYCEPEDKNEAFEELGELLNLLDDKYKREEHEWLVAVAPDGMIMAESVFEKCFIKNGTAIGVVYVEQLGKKKIEMEHLDWYKADCNTMKDYLRKRRCIPSKIYGSIHDFGVENFTKIKEAMVDKEDIISTKESEIELHFTKSKFGEPKRKILLGKFNAYLGNLGDQHLLNIAFSKANEELEGTEYEQECWKELSQKNKSIREKYYKFMKRTKNGEMAVLSIVKRF